MSLQNIMRWSYLSYYIPDQYGNMQLSKPLATFYEYEMYQHNSFRAENTQRLKSSYRDLRWLARGAYHYLTENAVRVGLRVARAGDLKVFSCHGNHQVTRTIYNV